MRIKMMRSKFILILFCLFMVIGVLAYAGSVVGFEKILQFGNRSDVAMDQIENSTDLTPTPILDMAGEASKEKETVVSENSEQSLAKPTVTRQPTLTVKKVQCNPGLDVCFEQTSAEISLMEGYEEYQDRWQNDQLKIVGQGKAGYELSWEGAKEVKAHSAHTNFENGSNDPIIISVQKNVTPKGTYKGVVRLKSLVSNKVYALNLTVNYVDWNESAIHVEPTKIHVDCKSQVHSGGVPYWHCDYLAGESKVTFHKYKHNAKVELRREDGGAEIRLPAEFKFGQSPYDLNDVAIIYFGYPTIPERLHPRAVEKPKREYAGKVSIIDQSTQKELISIPYTIWFHYE